MTFDWVVCGASCDLHPHEICDFCTGEEGHESTGKSGLNRFDFCLSLSNNIIIKNVKTATAALFCALCCFSVYFIALLLQFSTLTLYLQ